MTSSIKDKFSKMTSRSTVSSSDEDGSPTPTEKYLLKVTAGTSYQASTEKTVVTNGDDCVLNDKTRVAVRIQEYQGIPGQSVATSDYFKDAAHTKDTYSIAFSWIPETDVSADDLTWGIELINPIRDRIPSRFITTAFEVCKRFVDSSLDCDPDADQPWVSGAILCGSAMTWYVGSESNQAAPLAKVLAEGGDDSGQKLRQEHSIPEDESKRRKYFANEDKRKGFAFEKERCYQFDFHNGYIDWKNYALKLPGFSLNVLRWINNRTHTVRFALKNRKTGQPYLIVTFRLLFGEELKRELGDSRRSSQEEQQHSSSDSEDEQLVGGVQIERSNNTGAKDAAANYHAEMMDEEEQPSAKTAMTPEQPAQGVQIQDQQPRTRSQSADAAELSEQTEALSMQDEPRSDLEDTPESRGFRHSIEESLCNTATIDGRNTSQHVFD